MTAADSAQSLLYRGSRGSLQTARDRAGTKTETVSVTMMKVAMLGLLGMASAKYFTVDEQMVRSTVNMKCGAGRGA